MKWRVLFLAAILSLYLYLSFAEQSIKSALSTVTLFFPGLNGFVATKMPELLIYEKA
ncbi:hypothetical protein [Erwinia sp. 9145]|uniref:hypothetical protein n=1 Tax=Erwinia sp. 9145 TaxID=1500895 RepID=UPI0012E032F9|nr:hypothetical protein [Erwinia sp. 9145]